MADTIMTATESAALKSAPANITEFMAEVVQLSQQMNDQIQVVGDTAHGMAIRVANGAEAMAKHNALIIDQLEKQGYELSVIRDKTEDTYEQSKKAYDDHLLLITKLRETFAAQISELYAMAGIDA